ncbi:hypothetical protein AAG594_08780 [Citromicrobium bathyomarinum]
MDDDANTGTDCDCQPLPENPGAALVIGMLFLKLGGTLTTDSDGKRWIGQIEPCAYRFRGEEMPQLAGAKPHEQFLSVEQWRGATRMLMYLVQRLDQADLDLLFDTMAPCALKDDFDFRKLGNFQAGGPA